MAIFFKHVCDKLSDRPNSIAELSDRIPCVFQGVQKICEGFLAVRMALPKAFLNGF